MTSTSKVYLLLLASSILVPGGDASLKVSEKFVAEIKIKPSFPGIDSKTCEEPCSPSIIAELYHSWNEKTKLLEDPPFSPILYWRDKNRDPISYNGIHRIVRTLDLSRG